MKKLKDALVNDTCDHVIHDTVYGGKFECINLRYDVHIPRIYFIPKEAVELIKTEELMTTNLDDMKALSHQDIMVNGGSFNFQGTDVTFPPGSYLTYNQKSMHTVKYKNEVVEVNGVALDDIWHKDGILYVGDNGVLFEKNGWWNTGPGHFNISSTLLKSMRDDGFVTKIENSRIQDHITETKVITKKDVDGQFIFLTSGNVTIQYKTVTDGAEVINEQRNIKPKTIIELTQDIEIISGDNFNMYEFYAVKDRKSLYDNAWLDG
tara:strand:+ start:2734 stop:3525 length:792 start_codon:yes stop_codon:yes gene_type:complete